MTLEDALGFIAGILTTTAFLPQALLAWRTRDLRGVSLPMYVIFTTGVALWLVYGILTESLPVIAANAVTLPTALLILALKIRESSGLRGSKQDSGQDSTRDAAQTPD